VYEKISVQPLGQVAVNLPSDPNIWLKSRNALIIIIIIIICFFQDLSLVLPAAAAHCSQINFFAKKSDRPVFLKTGFSCNFLSERRPTCTIYFFINITFLGLDDCHCFEFGQCFLKLVFGVFNPFLDKKFIKSRENNQKKKKNYLFFVAKFL